MRYNPILMYKYNRSSHRKTFADFKAGSPDPSHSYHMPFHWYPLTQILILYPCPHQTWLRIYRQAWASKLVLEPKLRPKDRHARSKVTWAQSTNMEGVHKVNKSQKTLDRRRIINCQIYKFSRSSFQIAWSGGHSKKEIAPRGIFQVMQNGIGTD